MSFIEEIDGNRLRQGQGKRWRGGGAQGKVKFRQQFLASYLSREKRIQVHAQVTAWIGVLIVADPGHRLAVHGPSYRKLIINLSVIDSHED